MRCHSKRELRSHNLKIILACIKEFFFFLVRYGIYVRILQTKTKVVFLKVQEPKRFESIETKIN